MSPARISTLFLIWSTVGIVANVPLGAVADRFSRRAALVASGVFQAAGYVLWITLPGYAGFAAGFVLWGLGGAFGSGALEALLYDGLSTAGAADRYPRVYSRVTAVGLLSQVPSAIAASALFATGGYDLVGWVSVACCLGSAALATRLPEVRWRASGAGTVTPADPADANGPVDATGAMDLSPADAAGLSPADALGLSPAEAADFAEAGYVAVLRTGLAETARNPAVRAAIVAVAFLGALDSLEEYFPLLAHDWGVSTSLVPLAVLGIPLVGAAGAALGGAASRLRPRTLGLILAGAVLAFGGAGLLRRPAGVAGIAVAYGLYQLVLVVTDVRLQRRIEGDARATVTSVAALGIDVAGVVLYGAWALDLPILVAGLTLAMAVALPRLLREEGTGSEARSRPPQAA